MPVRNRRAKPDADEPPRKQPRRPDAIGDLRRADPFVRAVALRWRRLTGMSDAPTLIACSGGADSTALTLALALSSRRVAVGHVLHDLRPRQEAEGDRDAARRLAEGFGLPFFEAEVRVGGGNAEGSARRKRYEALARLAEAAQCPFVATAHHADDQLETLLMLLLRGAGPRGFGGIADRRAISERVTVIRPMLGVSREQARDACRRAGITWREDATNLDPRRLRAALRSRVLPVLAELRPRGAFRAARAAALIRDAGRVVDDVAAEVFGDESSWDRRVLRDQPAIVVAAGLRRAALRLLSGRRADALGGRLVDDAVRAIRGPSTEPRRFDWPCGLRVEVTARRVRVLTASESRGA